MENVRKKIDLLYVAIWFS